MCKLIPDDFCHFQIGAKVQNVLGKQICFN